MAHAVLCEVCDKVGRPDKGVLLPDGWRRITISNPATLRKRGITAIVCTDKCGARFIKESWAKTPVGVIAA